MPDPASRRDIALTRESVSTGDDVFAPHARRVTVPAERTFADALVAIAKGYLPHVVGASVGWRVEADGRTIAWLVRRNAANGSTTTQVRGVASDARLTASALHFAYIPADRMATQGPTK